MDRICIAFRCERIVGRVFGESYRPTVCLSPSAIHALVHRISIYPLGCVPSCVLSILLSIHTTRRSPSMSSTVRRSDAASTSLRLRHSVYHTYQVDDMPRRDIAPRGVARLDRLRIVANNSIHHRVSKSCRSTQRLRHSPWRA